MIGQLVESGIVSILTASLCKSENEFPTRAEGQPLYGALGTASTAMFIYQVISL